MKRKMMGIAVMLFALMMTSFALRSARAAGATIIVPDDYPTIQEGINAAVAGDMVIVRDGTYLLTAALDFKGKAITVKSEHGASSCFLDGQNTTRVVYFHSGERSDSVLSGFTIQNGRMIYSPQQGGGIYCDSSSPTITDCTISANTAHAFGGTVASYAYGGGIYLNASSAIIRNCTIRGNRAEASASGRESISYGGGIYLNGGSPSITNCVISGNTASGGYYAYGGGIYSTGASPSITDSSIDNNSVLSGTSSTTQGGGMYVSTSVPSIINSIISSNSAKDGAGIYFAMSSVFSSLTNCTIVRNTATGNGGALYSAATSAKIINSILWEDSPQEVFNDATSNPTITYSDVYGGYAGTGNIDSSPLFGSIAHQDYHLASASPAINTGNNAASELPSQDKDGNARIIDGVVDMGAYEFSSSQSSDLVVYPQLAVGGGYEVILIVNNKSDSKWSGTAEPMNNDGSLDYLITSIVLNRKETKKFTLSGGATTKTAGFEIHGDGGSPNSAVSVAYFYNFYQDGQLQDSTGVPKGVPANKFTFPVEKSPTIDTGLAIRRRANQTDSQITLTLFDAAGNQLQQAYPGSDFASFFTEQFTGVSSPFIGSVVAESSDDFYLVVIRLEDTQPGFQLTSVPAEIN